jgi:hypothetical protein
MICRSRLGRVTIYRLLFQWVKAIANPTQHVDLVLKQRSPSSYWKVNCSSHELLISLKKLQWSLTASCFIIHVRTCTCLKLRWASGGPAAQSSEFTWRPQYRLSTLPVFTLNFLPYKTTAPASSIIYRPTINSTSPNLKTTLMTINSNDQNSKHDDVPNIMWSCQLCIR